MKRGPVTKPDDDTMSANCEVLLIVQFMANLEQSGSRIYDA